MRESRKKEKRPVRASHLGSVVLGAIAGMTAVVVAASAAATIFPDAFQLGDVRVETEAPEVATLPPEPEEDVISQEVKETTAAAEETTEAQTPEADLAAEAQKAAEEAAREAAERAGITEEPEGPASETTRAGDPKRETERTGPAGAEKETDSPGAREKRQENESRAAESPAGKTEAAGENRPGPGGA